MHISKTFLVYLATLAITATVLQGCKKEKTDSDISAAGDNALAEVLYQDALNIADEAAIAGNLNSYKAGTGISKQGASTTILSACATITHDSLVTADLDTITVDFGTNNCTAADGRNRRGKIIITYTGSYRDSLTTINITFNNYFVNDNQIKGTKTIINKGHIAGGHLVYTIIVDGQIVKANNGGSILWKANKEREWLEGENTIQWSDDVYSLTGSATGTDSKGIDYTTTITNPLIRKLALGCRRHFVQGTLEITPSNKPIRIVDFGTGSCDDVATVTINGNVYTIQLR